MEFLRKLFGIKPNPIIEILTDGASIIDVRTPFEYKSGHAAGAINIPLDQLQKMVNKIKQIKTPKVFYCASGMRSATAVSILKNNKIEDVYNAGSLHKVNRLIKAS